MPTVNMLDCWSFFKTKGAIDRVELQLHLKESNLILVCSFTHLIALLSFQDIAHIYKDSGI